MKKLTILTALISLMLLLISCGKMTQEEILKEYSKCEAIGQQGRYVEDFGGTVFCDYKEINEDKVMRCIKEYTNGIDEKYNNPDTVSNLREDNYSQVVKTCNEIFGEK